MLDPTEGVLHSRVGRTFLKRNLGGIVDVNSILADDRQELRIDVMTYRIIFTYNGIPGRPFVYQKKISKNEMAYAEEGVRKEMAKRDEKMKKKFVTKAAWMRDLSSDEVERRNAAWQKGLEEGLWKMEESLKEPVANTVTSGDAMTVETDI